MITDLFAKVSKGKLLFFYNINCQKKKIHLFNDKLYNQRIGKDIRRNLIPQHFTDD